MFEIIFIIIIILAIAYLIDLINSTTEKKCPYCKEIINTNATRCKHCLKDLDED